MLFSLYPPYRDANMVMDKFDEKLKQNRYVSVNNFFLFGKPKKRFRITRDPDYSGNSL